MQTSFPSMSRLVRKALRASSGRYRRYRVNDDPPLLVGLQEQGFRFDARYPMLSQQD